MEEMKQLNQIALTEIIPEKKQQADASKPGAQSEEESKTEDNQQESTPTATQPTSSSSTTGSIARC